MRQHFSVPFEEKDEQYSCKFIHFYAFSFQKLSDIFASNKKNYTFAVHTKT